jgi:hypothetical protein
VNHFLGRIFTSPEVLFSESMLKPELQDMAVFADGLDNMMTTHQRVAENYFRDGSIQLACPPLKALLHLMKDGQYEGRTLRDPEIRDLFSPDQILSSDWYRLRLESKQKRDIEHWKRMLDYLHQYERPISRLDALRKTAEARLQSAKDTAYLDQLEGTIGREQGFYPGE